MKGKAAGARHPEGTPCACTHTGLPNRAPKHLGCHSGTPMLPHVATAAWPIWPPLHSTGPPKRTSSSSPRQAQQPAPHGAILGKRREKTGAGREQSHSSRSQRRWAGLCFAARELQSPQGAPALQEPRRSSAGALIHSRARCRHQGWGEAAPGAAVQARDSCGPGRWSANRGSPRIRRLWSGLTHGAASCGAVF